MVVKKLVFILVWYIGSSGYVPFEVYPVFGVRVSIGANSQINTYVCMINNGRTYAHKKVVDEATFIKIISGYWPSIYNPERINYFEKNNIECGIYQDSISKEEFARCVPFDSLWKIRFSAFPFRNRSENGWSNKFNKPSLKQELYLYNRYGVASVDANFFLDTNFWMILSDVTDPAWVNNYRAME